MLNRSFIILFFCIALVTGADASRAADAASFLATPDLGVRETTPRGEAVEMHLPTDETYTPWLHDPDLFMEEQGDRVETHEVVEEDVNTIKLDNLVPPIHFQLGAVDIPEEYIEKLRDVLHGMRDRDNVRLHFVGHSDSLQLSPALQERYGDNVGLSRERAGTTAEYFQQALALPPEAISYEGMGDSQPVASNATEADRALNRRVEVQVWYDEITERMVEKEVIVPREVSLVQVCRSETVCKLRYKEGHAHRARVKNLIVPLRYDEGMITVPEEFVQQVGQALKNLDRKQNVVVKFIAYTDNSRLFGRDERIYGNQLGLSKAVARRVSLAVQEALGLPNIAVESEGKGAVSPVASNETEQGRALNRRVEVEFWHDDPLQDLPDEPQLCPEDAGAETLTRVYHSPSGEIEPILFENGKPVIPAGTAEHLRRIMDEITDKANARLRFVGYASNERLDRRTAAVYGDDIGLSTSRARRTMEALRGQMGLGEQQVEFEGRGYVQSDDVVNSGFVESDTSRVVVQVVYDELVALDDYEGVDIVRLTREVVTGNPFALNLMRISVDGKPIDDPGKSIPDVQRCIDVALDEAHIEFTHDSLKLQPRLNVTAWPRVIRYQDRDDTEFAENQVHFRLYSNYRSFIERAEVRIFAEEQSERDVPYAVIEMDSAGMAQWQADFQTFSAPGRKLKYLVRVYDTAGRFDETSAQWLAIMDEIDPAVTATNPQEELLVGYGESRIASRNIPLQGGTVKALGTSIPAEHGVWLAGNSVPVDKNGHFVAEEILPDGLHTVEVAVLDKAGNGHLYLRDLSLDKNDWFYVGIADLTASANKTNGPAKLLAPDKPQYSDDLSVQGRLAFYTKGKFGDGWGLTASADTREGALDEIFSNFLDKSPEALFRRIDPEYHLPTYGDDSTVTEDAPTLGKFYLRLAKDNNYAHWGNFKISYLDNTIAHVDRGLYGANLHYQTESTTSFGEQRFLADGFAAEPGTVAGRDEFRGTGGSLYFLRRQDVLQGSERIRIEVRDKDSGLVLEAKNLTPGLDYDFDYLQGRVLLAQPLSATADDNLLVKSDGLSGHAVYLVVRYEFTPGVDDLDKMATGGRLHYWFNDLLKVGLTTSNQEDIDGESKLNAADVTLRKSSESWLKLEAGSSEGAGERNTTSNDGGYAFNEAPLLEAGTKAMGYRLDTSVGFKDFFAKGRGRLTFYHQSLEAGYATPGHITNRDLTQYGGTLAVPLSDQVEMQLKADKAEQKEGLETTSGELNADYKLDEHWTLSSGVRYDSREDNSAVVPETQEEGKRTDLVARLLYDSRSRWTAYGYVQESLQTTRNRDDNGRLGAGGSYRLTDRFSLSGEASAGDLGAGGQLGTEYLYSDRTTLYLNYALENERTDNGLRARQGNLASGFRTRYSDSASIYLEERYTHGDVPTGLMHSTGVDLAPFDHVNLGANLDFGTLKDYQTGAETQRTAIGVSAGYGIEKLKLATAVEYRVDEAEMEDASSSKRTTWLLKNSLKFQLSADWRLLGKFNYSHSESSQGQFYDGEYTEAVLGYAYRPIRFDRLNALFKYTYFYNVPAPEQSSGLQENQPYEEVIVSDSSSTSPATSVIQRSHIWSADVMFDLTSRWTIGAKYAYRQGEVSMEREDPDFFTSRAHLYVVRVDWRFLHRWDALIEGRQLDLPDAHDQRRGVLVGLYRHLGQHVKVGAGYNFADFSDDLTDLSYRHQGLFINIVGMM
ncbi:MAG: OmpA family protein [Desulfuromonadales bacterium]|nr:OmpA family protein [Desulfuromonadales bacterium]MDW7757739.1 OmpA family protein [Desulfuromonadales bacterium]